jgi:chorismate synthase
MLRFVTAGESHGKCLSGILEGLPSGLSVDVDFVNRQLRRRQSGFGRGGRMKIEQDQIEITSGVRHGLTMGSPISFLIHNRDWQNWQATMSTTAAPEGAELRPVTRPRPGHADLGGALKYASHDARNVLERASARETAARVAVGALCRLLLLRFDVRIESHVLAVGTAGVPGAWEEIGFEAIAGIPEESPLHCTDAGAEAAMIRLIEAAAKDGDTLGGVAEIIAETVPPGLGSHEQWDRKLDGRLAQALMSIPAVKAVEIGSAFEAARTTGSKVHDEIFYDAEARAFHHKTNRAGGLVGGITNGAPLRARIFVKPIPTLRVPLQSVDLVTKETSLAAFERSDTCVVPAAGIVGEAMVGFILAQAFLEKFGGDSIQELRANFENYLRTIKEL